jgi:hypothetical protein
MHFPTSAYFAMMYKFSSRRGRRRKGTRNTAIKSPVNRFTVKGRFKWIKVHTTSIHAAIDKYVMLAVFTLKPHITSCHFYRFRSITHQIPFQFPTSSTYVLTSGSVRPICSWNFNSSVASSISGFK